MRNTGRKYTREEDEAIFKAVQENPHNLTKCFMALSATLDRTYRSISQRWYSYLSNPESPAYMGTAHIQLGKKSICRNRKLDYEAMKSHAENSKVSLWTKILKLLRIK